MHDSTSTTETTYEVNGNRYSSIDDIPEPFRSLFQDQNDNGIPDGFEDALPEIKSTRIVLQSNTSPGTIRHWLNHPEARRYRNQTPETSTLLCSNCGYDLTGNLVGGACTECGSAVIESIRHIAIPQRSALKDAIDFYFNYKRLCNLLISVIFVVLIWLIGDLVVGLLF